MKLTEGKIKEAQEVITALMAETGAYCVLIYAPNQHSDETVIELGIMPPTKDDNYQGDIIGGESLNDLYRQAMNERAEEAPF